MKRYLYPPQALHKYAWLGLLLLFTACTGDNEVEPEIVRLATVTYLTTPNGLGDNGCNDAAAEGILAFNPTTSHLCAHVFLFMNIRAHHHLFSYLP